MRATRSSTFALALTACTLPAHDDSASATATSTTAASTSSTTGAPTTTPAADGGEQTSVMPGDVSSIQGCDIWSEDCPEGQKCMPYSGDGDNAWDSLKCVPIVPDPDQVDEPCTVFGSAVSGEDSCDKHLICWDVDPDTGAGTCLAMCIGTPSEPDCADSYEICTIANGGVLILCLPQCDPLASDCEGPFNHCGPSPDDPSVFTCAFEGEEIFGALGPCDPPFGCRPGLLCADPALAVECDVLAEGCCLPFCDVDEPNTCPGAGQQCTPWYSDPSDAAPFNIDVGLCSLP